MSVSPPERPLRLLAWACDPRWHDEVVGDLLELYDDRCRTQGVGLARLVFWYDTLLFIRPRLVRRRSHRPVKPPLTMMWKSFFKTGLRHMRRHKIYTGINVAGLSVGMACCLLAFLYAWDELGYDDFHHLQDRIYRVSTDMVAPDGTERNFAGNAWPVGRIIRAEYPEVERLVHMRYHDPKVTYEGAFRYERIFYAEDGFLDLFDFPVITGDADRALEQPYSVVITRDVANRYFGGVDVVGETMTLRDSLAYQVTAVVEDPPRRSHLNFDALASYATFVADNDEAAGEPGTSVFGDYWMDVNMFNYVLLREDSDPDLVSARLESLYQDRVGDALAEMGYQAWPRVEPLKSVYLVAARSNPFGPRSDVRYVYLIGGIGLLVLLVAGVNFVNLSTARSLERAREVGLRKVMGSSRGLLVQQFVGDAVLTSLLSLVLAIGIAALARPFFNELTGKDLSFAFIGLGRFALVAGLVGLSVGLIAGFYPALVLSGFRPLTVLKGTFSRSRGGTALRRGLVVFQYTVSCILILATLVGFRQMKFMQSADVGFDREQIVVIDARRVPTSELLQSAETLRSEMRRHSGVEAVSIANAVPGRSGWRSIMVFPEGRAQDEGLTIEFIAVDHEFVDVFGLKIAAGRDFDPANPSDTGEAVLINEAAVVEMGFGSPEEAIGKYVQAPNRNAQGYVVGVVEGYHHHGLQENVRGIVYGIKPWRRYVGVRAATADFGSLLAGLEATWREVLPAYGFDYFFLDDDYDQQYASEARISRAFLTFAIISIVISCLGLFGLTAFTTAQRTKEIGVRKVLGASAPLIAGMLSREFLGLVVIAFVVAAPVAWLTLNRWLDGYAYRIDLGVGLFLATAMLAVGIAVLTVSYHSFRAATANPADAIRYE